MSLVGEEAIVRCRISQFAKRSQMRHGGRLAGDGLVSTWDLAATTGITLGPF